MATYESVKTGHSEFDHNAWAPFVQEVDYTVSDLVSLTLTIPLLQDTYVLGVAHEVTTIFSGGSPDILVGIEGDTDAFIKTGLIAFGTVGDFRHSMGGSGDLAQGKKMSKGDKILVTHAASIAAGAGKVYIIGFSAQTNWRTAGQI